MSDPEIVASPEQIAANRANAAHSTGPRTPEGKGRSAQNARKHGFAAAAYTVVGLEDLQEVANLRDDAIGFYQPENSQELFAVERIALTQQALLRAARLEAGLFTASLNQALATAGAPVAGATPDPAAGIEAAAAEQSNLLLAEGFVSGVSGSNAMSLCLRYSAHAERQHRRAVAEFDRLKALRPGLPGEPNPARLAGGVRAPKRAAPNEAKPPAVAAGQTKPIPPEPSEPPENSIDEILRRVTTCPNFVPLHPSRKPAAPRGAGPWPDAI